MEIIVITHGKMSKGIKNSIEMIYGEDDRISYISAYVDDYLLTQDYVEEITGILGESKEVVIFTDLLGGSVNTEILKLLSNYEFHLIANVNLSVMLEFIARSKFSEGNTFDTLIREIIDNKMVLPIYCNDLIKDGDIND